MTDKQPPLSVDILEQYKSLRAQADEFGNQLEKRITYVIETIWSAFGKRFDYWYVQGAEEGQLGDLAKCFRWGDDVQDLCIHPYEGEMVILLKNESEYGFGEGEFPQRWLYEDFEQELTDGVAAYKAKVARQKEEREQRRAARKAKKDALKKSAASKLSEAERDALGL